MDYYAILGIDPKADGAAIRRAFRGLAKRYHPDAGAGSSDEKFRAVTEAYETLSDPAKRRAYDLSRARTRRPAAPEPMVSRPVPVYRVPVRFSRPVDFTGGPFGEWDNMVEMLFRELMRPPWRGW